MREYQNDILQKNLEIYRSDLIIRSRWWFEFGDEKGLKNQLYIYPLSVWKSQDTKLILAPWFIVGVAKVTQYGLLLQISREGNHKWNAFALF